MFVCLFVCLLDSSRDVLPTLTHRRAMVLLVLYVKAEFENIASVEFPAPDYHYCFDVKDSQSDEVREGVFMSAGDTIELENSRGEANFVVKFPDSKKQASVSFVDVKGVTTKGVVGASGEMVPVMGFECRGLELETFHPTKGVKITSEGGTVWEDVDLSEDPDGWFEYCEKGGDSVGVTEFAFEIRKHKA